MNALCSEARKLVDKTTEAGAFQELKMNYRYSTLNPLLYTNTLKPQLVYSIAYMNIYIYHYCVQE